MKKLFLGFILAASLMFPALGTASAGDTYVNGYYKSNGTYVRPHYRTSPNSTNLDNYSTKGNVNPYTGKRGTVEPDYGSTYKSKRSGTYSGGLKPTFKRY